VYASEKDINIRTETVDNVYPVSIGTTEL